MDLAVAVAAVMFLGVIAYAVFAGADFGSGVWDLTAGGAEHGASLRSLVDRAIGPVWEANHVWLIFVLVYFWTGFPIAFAATMETLFIPFMLAGLGIVLRGSAFAFRKFSPSFNEARFFGALFAVSSIITPFIFGAIAGAIASGRVPLDGSGNRWTSWTGPASIVGGVLAVLTCAFLAAVFLFAESYRSGGTGRSDDEDLSDRCRRLALGAGIVTGVAALVAIIPLEQDAPVLFDGLTGRALPVVVISAIGGLVTIVAVWKRHPTVARIAAVVAVAGLVAGWGIGQYPWLLVDSVTIDDAAGARATLWALLVVFGLAAVTVVPSLVYLYWVTQRPSWLGRQATEPGLS